MLVSLEWLKDYVDIDGISAEEFCDRMIMTGSNLETCEELGAGIDGVKLGKILAIEKHPDADKLVVCKIDVGGEEPIQIVTGAPNVYEGAFIPVAVHGSTIPGPLHGQPKVEGGVKIKKGKLRGVESNGMLCSPEELGYGEKVVPMASKDGIWLLEGDWSEQVGMDLVDALGLKDYKIDFEITPNRPDCLSMIGMAREAAATFGRTLRYPETTCATIDEKAADNIAVEVKSDSCKRYTARVIKDVKIGQSPWWMQKKLMAAGMRPINNMVDITNFVMLEYGQPLHAFDIEGVAGRKIVVEMAEAGEKFVTLDGVERTLDNEVLMIKDAEKSIAIAGVMGGLNSEITEDTNTVIIESANFERSNIRQTSKKIGLRTEASGRYEKGIDPNLCEAAADRVCKLVEMLGCGTVMEGSVDVYPNPETAPTVAARVSRINGVIGIDISREEMVAMLESLEMKVEGEGDTMLVTPPSVRQDLLAEVDYVEEIARMYGYDNIPLTLPETATKSEFSKSWTLRNKIREILCSMGANEIQTLSFMNHGILDSVGIEEDSWERNMVELINPMGEETAALRTILTPSMLDVLARNYSRNIEAVRAYEIGLTYMKNLREDDGLPDEGYNIAIGMYGENEDFFTLKGMIEEMLKVLGIKKVIFEAESEYGVYHPGRCARVLVGFEGASNREKTIEGLEYQIANMPAMFGEEELQAMKDLVNVLSMSGDEGPVEIGIMGEIHPDVAERYGLGTRTYCCELFFDNIMEFANDEIHYTPLPKFPATSRDIAILVDENVAVGDVMTAIREHGTEILEDVKLFDIYRGQQVEEGKKSVAISLVYRHPEKTLTNEETQEVHEDILNTLNEKFDAVLREM
ncbi:MAG: phenylalanine--tRNA ligase subunit beta [Eubacterium sp.]|nr:phenylalanine--tRNA ligase subunit beta [Eubacterium sp.]